MRRWSSVEAAAIRSTCSTGRRGEGDDEPRRAATHDDRRDRGRGATRSPRADPRGDVAGVPARRARDPRRAPRRSSARKYRHTEVLPLYARLSARDQDRVFQPRRAAARRARDQRRRDLADHSAHPLRRRSRASRASSATAARRSSTACTSSRSRRPAPTSARAAAAASRPASAFGCTRKPTSRRAPRYTDPEILRAALAGVILRMMSLGLGERRGFPVPRPARPRAVADGWQQLEELGAVDEDARADRRSAGRWRACRSTSSWRGCSSPRTATRLPARGAGDRGLPRHPGSARAAGRRSAPPPTMRMRSSPTRIGIRRRAEALGRLSRGARGTDPVEAARWARRISSASCACANGASCIGSCLLVRGARLAAGRRRPAEYPPSTAR